MRRGGERGRRERRGGDRKGIWLEVLLLRGLSEFI